eukprot:CAMPEP_0179701386 /NCGR_PEP_ID=MMETSP0937-20121108/1739_1 /TAXON_ID=548131 ORGANISM="Ostreococcus mediterraneus, Strain clade-D-RCC2593" /NCGR_SAMPLE_ID=MMETSP0937 /ASSEMBLY_ACC=CAM_ASM_000575 /LENGTH=90 /DNA_ID=CAMNT_0021574495 /DNA_START=571 /DNA_END=843 /DNA_ORIENTATION=+
MNNGNAYATSMRDIVNARPSVEYTSTKKSLHARWLHKYTTLRSRHSSRDPGASFNRTFITVRVMNRAQTYDVDSLARWSREPQRVARVAE